MYVLHAICKSVQFAEGAVHITQARVWLGLGLGLG